MNQQMLKRIIACLLLGALVLGLLPMFAMATSVESEEQAKATASAPEPVVELTDSEESAIGIIGGADGPTAIFVTASPGGIISTLLLIAGGVCVVIAVLKKRKK